MDCSVPTLTKNGLMAMLLGHFRLVMSLSVNLLTG